MEESKAVAFLHEHAEVLYALWNQADNDGYTDLVFVWIVENDEEKQEGKLFSKYMAREEAYALVKDQDIPDYTKEQLSRPAGGGRAWLILLTPEGTASMRVARAVTGPGGDA